MKKAIAILVALLMVLSLAACGGGGNSDKDKLIGTWSFTGKYESTFLGNPYYDYREYSYSFAKDNTFYYQEKGFIGLEKKPYSEWEVQRVGKGTYTIKDGFVNITFDDPDTFGTKEPIPYYINEYTKELIFNVDRDGESRWSHTSKSAEVFSKPNTN